MGRVAAILRDAAPVLPPALVGESQAAAALRSRVTTLTGLEAPRLIQGESGTGRSSLARYIHGAGSPDASRLLRLVCDERAVLPEPLETGAIYLCDVDRASTDLQEALWARLAEHQGESSAKDLRVVASTERDLRQLTDDGRFHRDLARWLSRCPIELLPLRERLDDFDSIIRAVLARIVPRHAKVPVLIRKRAVERMKAHPWYGNLPELEEVLERIVVFARSDEICERQVEVALDGVEQPLERISRERARSEREHLLVLYRKHGTFAGVARELGITRNAARYRFRKYDLLPTGG